MKQSDIKNKCEQAYQNIKLQEDKIARLKSICKHPNTIVKNIEYYGEQAIICTDCKEIIGNFWEKLGEVKREDI